MKFISAEEFLNQPLEVRNVFINWWEPSVGDLILNPWVENGEDFSGPDRIRENITVIDRICDKKDFKEHLSEMDCIPGLTEGQLRQFIEDKCNDYDIYSKSSIEVSYYAENNIDICTAQKEVGYQIQILDTSDGEYIYSYFDLGTDLLQAYWKVACEIAKELVQNK